jgi:hypothetical protein
MFQDAVECLRKVASIVAVWSAAMVLAGCGSAMKPEDFANKQPRFIIEDYFAGKTKAWGIFEDRFGNLRREFLVDITGTWDGKQLVLDERFVYADGEKETRVWTIRKQDDHTYTGTAAGVVGTAIGKSYGNALNWSYDFDLKVGDGTWRVHFNDWMFLQPEGVMLNRAVVSKFGIDIGTVTLAFSKPAATQAEQRAAAIANGMRVAAE